jgi:RNA polymerase sigma-70 factor (ECF subfamily)
MTSAEWAVVAVERGGSGAPEEGDGARPGPDPAAGPDPFATFFERYHGPVLAYLRRRAPAEAADELAVSTFEVAWRRWAEVPVEHPLPWLYGVARRLLANERRGEERRGRLRRRLAAVPNLASRAGAGAGGDPGVTAVDAVVARQALARLRAEDRELLMLVAWDGLDVPAAAASLGVSPSTFAVRLHRARRRLEKLLPVHPPTAEDLP